MHKIVTKNVTLSVAYLGEGEGHGAMLTFEPALILLRRF